MYEPDASPSPLPSVKAVLQQSAAIVKKQFRQRRDLQNTFAERSEARRCPNIFAVCLEVKEAEQHKGKDVELAAGVMV